jgi:hypothetical protein
MELVEGNTLDERIKSGSIPVEEALEAAHEKGVPIGGIRRGFGDRILYQIPPWLLIKCIMLTILEFHYDFTTVSGRNGAKC